MVNADNYLVYWIHHPKHKNPKTEGYVGVTSRSLIIRCNQHVSNAMQKDNTHIILHNAIRKYESDLKVALLGVGDEEFAYDLEYFYRPKESVGWNIRPGGQHLDSETQKSFWNRPGYREGHIKRMKALWEDEEFREKNLPNLQLGVELFQEKVSRKPWITGRAVWTRHNVWPFAQDYYEAWVENGCPGRENFSKLVGHDSKSMKKIHNMFCDGWVPNQDTNWITDFNNGKYVGEGDSGHRFSVAEDSKSKISESLLKTNAQKSPWEFPRANKDVWRQAEDLYAYWVTDQDCGYKKMAIRFGLPDQSCKTILKNFLSGWEPLKDDKWINYFKRVSDE